MSKLKRRVIPRVRFTNFHKKFPISKGIWNEWFMVRRMWMGSIIEIQVRHYQISLDFRKNWMNDMLLKKAGEK